VAFTVSTVPALIFPSAGIFGSIEYEPFSAEAKVTVNDSADFKGLSFAPAIVFLLTAQLIKVVNTMIEANCFGYHSHEHQSTLISL
jgi:hypothetical protein